VVGLLLLLGPVVIIGVFVCVVLVWFTMGVLDVSSSVSDICFGWEFYCMGGLIVRVGFLSLSFDRCSVIYFVPFCGVRAVCACVVEVDWRFEA